MTQKTGSTTSHSIVQGRRVALGRHLAITSRDDWKRLIKQHGGHPIDQLDELTDLLLLNADEAPNFDALPKPVRNKVEILHEEELWQILKMPESDIDLSRLYTLQMLARLLEVPVAAVRRWHRRGLISPVHQINKLPYFDFQEIASARRIARWIQNGQSPAAIERQLAEIAQTSGDHRPLSQLSIIVQGQKVLLRAGEGLVTANGQLHFEFQDGLDRPTDTARRHLKIAEIPEVDSWDQYEVGLGEIEQSEAEQYDQPDVLPFAQVGSFTNRAGADVEKSPDQFIRWATELEDDGDVLAAVDVYRAMALAHGISPDINFRIAELLYQSGDLSAARERYFSAIELDETFVEARASLGCVLVELSQNELAIAAFRGALDYHRNFADVHFHLARLLDETGRTDDATTHWEAFLELAPKSPWAEEARQRMRSLEKSETANLF